MEPGPARDRKRDVTHQKVKLPVSLVIPKETEAELEEEMFFTNPLSKAEVSQPTVVQDLGAMTVGPTLGSPPALCRCPLAFLTLPTSPVPK